MVVRDISVMDRKLFGFLMMIKSYLLNLLWIYENYKIYEIIGVRKKISLG